MEKQPAVYIVAKDRNATLYTGVTSIIDGFTKRYDVGKLVWFELHGEMISAITREKQIKK